MKKALALLMAALLLFLAGCRPQEPESQPSAAESHADKEEKPALTVCVDMDIGGDFNSSTMLSDLIREYAPRFKDSYKLDILSVPGTGADREPMLDHIRVEMMAGGGPDLFLCESPNAADPNFGRERETGLFQFPKALMKRHMFLPLDGYIESAQYMEWDKLYPQIMEAGRNGEGQLILPISWNMQFSTFDAKKYTPTEDLPMTFDEMLQSDDPGIRCAAWTFDFGGSLGSVADYEKEEPAFTEEELTAHLEGLRLNSEGRTVELNESLGNPGLADFGRMNAQHFTQYDPDSVLIPQYNRDGGATAYITSFGAVNINSKSPEGAFLILDLLLSKEVQQDSELLSYDSGAPVHMELLKSNEKINAPFEDSSGRTVSRWDLSDYNYDRLQELIKEINAVDFVTPVHHELRELYNPYTRAEKREDREKLVAEAYRNMKMMLAES